MTKDTRPIALIPAYKPEHSILKVAEGLLQSGCFCAVYCVDDGSGNTFQKIFDGLEKMGVIVLRHVVNLGKGMALKTGLNSIGCAHPDSIGVVTLDADGQHLVHDVINVASTLTRSPHSLILGSRQFQGSIPFRSRFGNEVTRAAVRFLVGVRVGDTQTGLRGIPMTLFPILLRLDSKGYEFEMEMLVKANSHRIKLLEVPIETVYLEDNKSSHFKPLRDSIAIYFIIFRHCLNAFATGVIDYAGFSLACMFGSSLLFSMVCGRVAAGAFNFVVGKKFVFKSRGRVFPELLAYISLVLILLASSYGLISLLVRYFYISPYFSKIIAELVVFFLSFSMQRLFVFRTSECSISETDWETYYRERSGWSSPTRKITQRLLLSLMESAGSKKPNSICEFGGGDSCFHEAIREKYPESHYLILDKSAVGIEKFKARCNNPLTKALEIDIFTAQLEPSSDIVFSVGLIEHFSEQETSQMIKKHFEAAKVGGLVIITYPTPTLLYRFIRGAAELLGVWKFHDERPLGREEVDREISKYGIIVENRLNWKIGLTQQIVVAKKFIRNDN